jgi:phosphomannomutase
MKKTIVLFDMDGTLTKPRKAFERKLLPTLSKLASLTEIGIVSGSDHNYIREQMALVIDKTEIRYKMHLLPCNGTKHYTPPKSNEDVYELVHEVNMKEEIGENNFNRLVRLLIERQYYFSHTLPCFSGTFIDYRGSMINWCPVGRSAIPSERKAFIDLDTSHSPTLREQQRIALLKAFADLGLEIKIGGDTSFDIYPTGWDKTYSLKHFSGYDAWFVGDKCDIGGNDKELFDYLYYKGRSFETTDPELTLRIIQERIIPDLKKL